MDADGRRTREPMGSGQATQVAIVVTMLGWVASLVALGGASGTVCWLLDRHPYRRWAEEWAAVEPAWTRRVP